MILRALRSPRELNRTLGGLDLSLCPPAQEPQIPKEVPGPRETEVVDELSQHLDDRYRELVAGGATAEEATRLTLVRWTERLRQETGDQFPEKVTAFREGMAVHGRFRKPCPVCGTAVQRIAYADNETNYCPRCQTGGRILSDRSLSRLLKSDWPKSIEELEEKMPARAPRPGVD